MKKLIVGIFLIIMGACNSDTTNYERELLIGSSLGIVDQYVVELLEVRTTNEIRETTIPVNVDEEKVYMDVVFEITNKSSNILDCEDIFVGEACATAESKYVAEYHAFETLGNRDIVPGETTKYHIVFLVPNKKEKYKLIFDSVNEVVDDGYYYIYEIVE